MRHCACAVAVVAMLVIVGCDTQRIVEAIESLWSSLSPQTATLRAIGATLQLNAVNATGVPVTVPGLTWQPLEPAIVQVDGVGRATAVAPGTARIVGATTSPAQADTVTIEVRQDVALLTVSPSPASVQVGSTQPMTAALRDANGYAITGRTITWSSGNTSVATVNGSGLVTGVAAGAATITATSEGTAGSSIVTVTTAPPPPPPPPPPVATVTVTPATATLNAGSTVQLSATLRDAGGNVLTGRTVTWTTSASGVATVFPTGLVTGVSAGAATITATSEGVSGTSAITVTVPPVATVTVSPATASVTVGQTRQLSATLRDAGGNVLTGRTLTWSSSNTGIATVNGSGLVSAVAAGAATITATSEGKSGTSAITVTSVTPVVGNYFVSPNGSDANPGTESAPFRTIDKAASLVTPGDVVIVEDGVWTDTDGDGSVATINRGGTAAAFVTFKARNRWGARLDGQNGRTAQGFDLNNGIGYVRIEGFEIYGVANVGSPSTGRGSASGIDLYDGGHDSQIVGNHIHDIGRVCTLSTNTNGQVGIFVQQPNVTVEGNLIHDIGRFFPGENGCSYTGFTGYMTLDHGMYLNGGAPGADGTLIRNNVFYNTRHGWAVQWYPGSLTNVHVLNNTFAFGNPNKNYTSIVLDASISASSIVNNIFYNPEGGRTIEASGFSGTITIANNITMGSAMTDRSSIPAGMTLTNNQLNTNALFVNAAGFDFHLQAGSPAVDAGQTLSLVRLDFEGRTRPRGTAYDIGAYEF
jgi:uncharacterized protein YjdB